MIINDSYEMSPDIQLTEVQGGNGIAQSIVRTLGGIVVQTSDVIAGKQYELTADSRGDKLYGFFTRADKAYLSALRDTVSVFKVEHQSMVLDSVFIPADGINLEIWEPDETVEQESSERLFGTVKIIRV